ncbi:MAG: hypothetical protein NTZ60_09360 [Campylobacterales bacterium]|nr:hypothetical protein [Campylobacterales bacterium]
MNPRLVPIHINISFSEAAKDEKAHEQEYHKLNEADSSIVNQWVKHARSKGDATEIELVVLNLLVELHNKVDALEMLLKHETPNRIALDGQTSIDAIGFEHFSVNEPVLTVGTEYYGRVEMPFHPKRDVGVFFEALSPTLAHITKTHERDEKEWGAFLTARERVLIREAKENKK